MSQLALLNFVQQLSRCTTTDAVADAYIDCIAGVVRGARQPAFFAVAGLDSSKLRARGTRAHGATRYEGCITQATALGGALMLPDDAGLATCVLPLYSGHAPWRLSGKQRESSEVGELIGAIVLAQSGGDVVDAVAAMPESESAADDNLTLLPLASLRDDVFSGAAHDPSASTLPAGEPISADEPTHASKRPSALGKERRASTPEAKRRVSSPSAHSTSPEARPSTPGLRRASEANANLQSPSPLTLETPQSRAEYYGFGRRSLQTLEQMAHLAGAALHRVLHLEQSNYIETQEMLTRLLPPHVAQQLMQTQVASGGMLQAPSAHMRAAIGGDTMVVESSTAACVLFSELVGFEDYCNTHSPAEVVELLNTMFAVFDCLLDKHPGVYKVETINSIYMLVTGLPWLTPVASPAIDLARMGLDMIDAMGAVEERLNRESGTPASGSPSSGNSPRRSSEEYLPAEMPRGGARAGGESGLNSMTDKSRSSSSNNLSELPNPAPAASGGGRLSIRVGMHAGPITAGVIGNVVPRYCLYGDTVNVAARMQTTGKPSCVQMSKHARDVLVADLESRPDLPPMSPLERGVLPIKGKGEMTTFLLHQRSRPLARHSTIGAEIHRALAHLSIYSSPLLSAITGRVRLGASPGHRRAHRRASGTSSLDGSAPSAAPPGRRSSSDATTGARRSFDAGAQPGRFAIGIGPTQSALASPGSSRRPSLVDRRHSLPEGSTKELSAIGELSGIQVELQSSKAEGGSPPGARTAKRSESLRFGWRSSAATSAPS